MDTKLLQSEDMELAHIYAASEKITISNDIDYSSFCGGLQINIPVKKSSNSLRVEVQGFNDLNILWLNKIYREYEGQIWTKCVTSDERMKFHCLFCNKVLCRFFSLRNHLNLHFEIYPFKCCACEKKYTSNGSLYKHRIAKHSRK